ncbi:MAG: hypothetical protein JXB00_03875 [Bacteroidales bacterium]|nr:hypothetical protein [Bacteroidales bacterium]
MKAFVTLAFIFLAVRAMPQCLSSVNPVGGTNNLLVLQPKALRIITFYKFNYGNQYFEEDHPSDFNLIKNANYSYIGTIAAYGIASRFTFETEAGYFINKTQIYNLVPEQKLRGYGFSNIVLSARYGVLINNQKRIFHSLSAGVKVPSSNKFQYSQGVELPDEVQPTLGSYGLVFQSFLVKEYSFRGLRFFFTNRFETNRTNNQGFRPGSSLFTSLFVSKHLMFQWLKGDWTTILQLRNELRAKNTREGKTVSASGGNLFFLSPQINYTIREAWNLSLMGDIPLYQYLNGIQIGTKAGITLGLSRDFHF